MRNYWYFLLPKPSVHGGSCGRLSGHSALVNNLIDLSLLYQSAELVSIKPRSHRVLCHKTWRDEDERGNERLDKPGWERDIKIESDKEREGRFVTMAWSRGLAMFFSHLQATCVNWIIRCGNWVEILFFLTDKKSLKWSHGTRRRKTVGEV